MSNNEMSLSDLNGMDVYLPDGRFLGVIHETVVDGTEMKATHLFVTNTPAELVEGSVNLTVPWRWVRSVGEIVLLRWFPKTPIPLHF